MLAGFCGLNSSCVSFGCNFSYFYLLSIEMGLGNDCKNKNIKYLTDKKTNSNLWIFFADPTEENKLRILLEC